jgi:large subunit ribosomal protein L14
MIQVGTVLNIVDNSGGRKVRCIKVPLGYSRRYAGIGDVVLVSVKSLRTKRRTVSKVKKGDIFQALIIRTYSKKSSLSGESLQFLENSAILLNRQNKFLGSRIFGSIPGNFRFSKYLRAVSLCAGLVS